MLTPVRRGRRSASRLAFGQAAAEAGRRPRNFHTLVPDGVFILDGDGPPSFVATPPPRDEDVAGILERVVRRAAKVLVGFDEEVESEADAMAALQAAEVDRRLRFPDEFRHSRHGAFLDGFSLHAGVRIHGNDRDGRERLCRYLLRPPLSLPSGSRRARRAGSSTG